MTSPTAHNLAVDPQTDLEEAAGRIRRLGWWRHAGMQEHWPLSTGEVARLLADGAEFDVDAADLGDLIARRMLGAPGVDECGELEWNAADVDQAGGVLKDRFQFRETPSRRDDNKHLLQLFLERARQCGAVARIVNSGPKRFDVRDLLGALAMCDDRNGRLALIALLKGVLEVDFGTFIP